MFNYIRNGLVPSEGPKKKPRSGDGNVVIKQEDEQVHRTYGRRSGSSLTHRVNAYAEIRSGAPAHRPQHAGSPALQSRDPSSYETQVPGEKSSTNRGREIKIAGTGEGQTLSENPDNDSGRSGRQVSVAIDNSNKNGQGSPTTPDTGGSNSYPALRYQGVNAYRAGARAPQTPTNRDNTIQSSTTGLPSNNLNNGGGANVLSSDRQRFPINNNANVRNSDFAQIHSNSSVNVRNSELKQNHSNGSTNVPNSNVSQNYSSHGATVPGLGLANIQLNNDQTRGRPRFSNADLTRESNNDQDIWDFAHSPEVVSDLRPSSRGLSNSNPTLHRTDINTPDRYRNEDHQYPSLSEAPLLDHNDLFVTPVIGNNFSSSPGLGFSNPRLGGASSSQISIRDSPSPLTLTQAVRHRGRLETQGLSSRDLSGIDPPRQKPLFVGETPPRASQATNLGREEPHRGRTSTRLLRSDNRREEGMPATTANMGRAQQAGHPSGPNNEYVDDQNWRGRRANRNPSIERGPSGYFHARNSSDPGARTRRRGREDWVNNWNRLQRQINNTARGRAVIQYIREREERARRELSRADGDSFYQNHLKLFKKNISAKEAVQRLNNAILVRLQTPGQNNSLGVRKLMVRDIITAIETIENQTANDSFTPMAPPFSLLRQLGLSYHACGILEEIDGPIAPFRLFDDEDEETDEVNQDDEGGMAAPPRVRSAANVQEQLGQQPAGPVPQRVNSTRHWSPAGRLTTSWTIQLAGIENRRLRAELEKEKAKSRRAEQWPEEMRAVVLDMAEQKIREHHETVGHSTEGLLRMAGEIREMDVFAADKMLAEAQRKLEEDAKNISEQRGRGQKRKRDQMEEVGEQDDE